MADQYDVAGLVSVRVDAGTGDPLRDAVRAQLDPYEQQAWGTESRVAEVVLARGPLPSGERVIDAQGTTGDGVLTCWDGRHLHVVRSGRVCRVSLGPGGPSAFVLDPGFPVGPLFRSYVRSAIQLQLLQHGAVAVHAACVATPAGAVLIAGWSESGKTETALAMAESGAGFVSDKWTVVGPAGTAAPFPVPVGLRRWVVPHLPRLRAALPVAARARFGAAAAVSAAGAGLRRPAIRSEVGQLVRDASERVVGLADRVSLPLSHVRSVYGGPAPSDGPHHRVVTVVLLSTVPEDLVQVTDADPLWAARRLAVSAAYERSRCFDLLRRHRYAAADAELPDAVTEVEVRERALLLPVLEQTRLLRVAAPFPTDPRRVADAVQDALSSS